MRMDARIERRLDLHRKFWKGEELDHIPVSFRIGDYFFADKFNAALPLLKPGLKIEPSMLDVDVFLEDYERMFEEIGRTGQDGFWTAEPFTGIPWLEAILGCPVFAGTHSFVTEPALGEEEYFAGLDDLENNLWYLKYMEFVSKLVKLSDGRFPVGQPIMRGISDVLGALMGQVRFIYEMNDEPEKTKELAYKIAEIFKTVISRQTALVPDFYGGWSMGFYHVWCPGKCIWFQEDLSALLSPALYGEFVMPCDTDVCKGYDYTAVHLHSSSFHILERLLSIEGLKAVEINKDIGGLPVEEMLPVFRKVLEAGRRLILWGSLEQEEIALIRSSLPSRGIFLNIIAEGVEKAKELKQILE